MDANRTLLLALLYQTVIKISPKNATEEEIHTMFKRLSVAFLTEQERLGRAASLQVIEDVQNDPNVNIAQLN
jgi:hypothetical protein